MAAQSMTEHEREEFLAGVHVGVLAVERADGPPLAVPVWYGYRPGGAVEVLTSAASLKGRLTAAAGRASLCAQQEELPYRYVSVEGPATVEPLGDATRGEIEVMAIRYLGEEMGRAYAAGGVADDEMRISITPERWYSVDYGKPG
ncbi:MAG: pyridoxamine 5'-phosphate oxidase family protein [Actinomycetota bacterium]